VEEKNLRWNCLLTQCIYVKWVFNI
jgi:hypothetical protein